MGRTAPAGNLSGCRRPQYGCAAQGKSTPFVRRRRAWEGPRDTAVSPLRRPPAARCGYPPVPPRANRSPRGEDRHRPAGWDGGHEAGAAVRRYRTSQTRPGFGTSGTTVDRLAVPDLPVVLGDRAVGRELAGAGDVEDRLLRPLVGRPVELRHALLRIDEAAQVGEVHVVVAVLEQPADDRAENPRFGQAEEIVADQVDRAADLVVALVVAARIIVAV